MQPSHPSARSLLSVAVVIMAVIVAWRISSPVAAILHDYDMHVRLMSAVPHPAPKVPAKPRVIVIPPKLYCLP